MTRPRAMQSHREDVFSRFWSYADRHHSGQLDGGKRDRRLPVFAPHFASNNVLVPSDERTADKIRGAIQNGQRHTWFRSMRSSQALTQSVLGAVRSFDRLDLLEGVAAECGRLAFFDSREGWGMSFEHKVEGLGEWRPTSVDVLLSRSGQLVAIECKFLEDEFGKCSRTDKSRYKNPCLHCNGNYQIQNGRETRCALTEAGRRYWEFLPHLFNWQSDRDHLPCPFGQTYQLARNALAATVSSDGEVRSANGHVLLIYDARNPAFQVDGKAYEQLQIVTGASQHPGLFRLLSWQSLLAALVNASELVYLIDGLGEKYGIQPV